MDEWITREEVAGILGVRLGAVARSLQSSGQTVRKKPTIINGHRRTLYERAPVEAATDRSLWPARTRTQGRRKPAAGPRCRRCSCLLSGFPHSPNKDYCDECYAIEVGDLKLHEEFITGVVLA